MTRRRVLFNAYLSNFLSLHQYPSCRHSGIYTIIHHTHTQIQRYFPSDSTFFIFYSRMHQHIQFYLCINRGLLFWKKISNMNVGIHCGAIIYSLSSLCNYLFLDSWVFIIFLLCCFKLKKEEIKINVGKTLKKSRMKYIKIKWK